MIPGLDEAHRFAAEMVAWLMTYLLHSSVALGLVALGTHGRRPGVLTDVLWKSALVGPITTATVAVALGSTGHAGGLLPLPGSPESLGPEGIENASGGNVWFLLLTMLWVLSASVSLGVWWSRRWRAWRPLRVRPPLENAQLRGIVEGLCISMRFRRRIRLTTTLAIPSPAAIGWNEICLPHHARAILSTRQLEGILAHEVAHLVRRDPIWRLVAEVVVRSLFFQPLNRLARLRLHEISEMLCDDAAVRHSGHPTTLVESLAVLAAEVRPVRAAPVVAFGESSSLLMRRVRRLLIDRAGADVPSRAAQRLTGVGLIVVLWAFVPAVAGPGNDRVMPWWEALRSEEEIILYAPRGSGEAIPVGADRPSSWWDMLRTEEEVLLPSAPPGNGEAVSEVAEQ